MRLVLSEDILAIHNLGRYSFERVVQVLHRLDMSGGRCVII